MWVRVLSACWILGSCGSAQSETLRLATARARSSTSQRIATRRFWLRHCDWGRVPRRRSDCVQTVGLRAHVPLRPAERFFDRCSGGTGLVSCSQPCPSEIECPRRASGDSKVEKILEVDEFGEAIQKLKTGSHDDHVKWTMQVRCSVIVQQGERGISLLTLRGNGHAGPAAWILGPLLQEARCQEDLVGEFRCSSTGARASSLKCAIGQVERIAHEEQAWGEEDPT